MCFFGGKYWLTLAAIEAFRMTGWEKLSNCMGDLWDDWKAMSQENKLDDARDDNADGIADVEQMDAQTLVSHKMLLLLRTVNTDRVTTALSGLTQGILGVVGTLQSELARTLALGASIGEQVRKPSIAHLAPALGHALPSAYHRWIPSLIDAACKLLSILLCWHIRAAVSTLQSAVKGGLASARAMLAYANSRGLTSLTDADTLADEYAGWALAAAGAYFQVPSEFPS